MKASNIKHISTVDIYLHKQGVFTLSGFLTGDELVNALKVVVQGEDPSDLSLAYCALKYGEQFLIE